jgi:hypothetical protein
MGTHKVNFIKSNNTWFADFTETELTPKINGVNQQHLKHLNGEWDAWLEIVSDNSENFWATLSDSPILNGTEIKKLKEINPNGVNRGPAVSFKLETYKGVDHNIKFWVCSNAVEFTNGHVPSSWYFLKHD